MSSSKKAESRSRQVGLDIPSSKRRRPIDSASSSQTLDDSESQKVTSDDSWILCKTFPIDLAKDETTHLSTDSSDSQTLEIVLCDNVSESEQQLAKKESKCQDDGPENLRHCDSNEQEQSPIDGMSKNFMDACKVINRYLTDLDKDQRYNLSGPTVLVREKWFEIAGSNTSSVDQVQKYLHFFRSLSKEMLKWVVNCIDSEGNTVIHCALAKSNLGVVKLLLQTGVCDLDIPNIRERTPLMTAVNSGNKSVVKMLLKAGSDINAEDIDGYTALMHAARQGDVECTRLLLKNPKCDVLMEDLNGNDACTIALNAGHLVVHHLIDSHASDIEVPSKLKKEKESVKFKKLLL